MSAAAWLEVRHALTGTLRLARGDRGGLACFDPSLEGFWRSYRAAVLAYPLYLALVGMRVTPTEWAAAGTIRVLLVESIAYVIGWVAFPLAILPVAAWLDREHRFLGFMVAYNWFQLPQCALFVLLGAIQLSGAANAGVAFLDLLVTVAIISYEWYLARVALDTSGTAAVLIVLIDLVLGVLIGRIAGELY